VHIRQERLEVTGDDGVVTVTGELDAFAAPALSDALTAAGLTAGDLTLDLAGVSFVDSAALRLLMLTQHEVVESGHAFRLRSPSPAVQRLLHVSGLDEHFELA
jgi:anti-anti-sigma factor